MAEFSKQWCDLYDTEMSWDFNIIEEANKIPNGQHVNMICEGFGFTAIGKNDNGEILLAFDKKLINTNNPSTPSTDIVTENDNNVEWVSYNDVIK
jgi:hypothetical protein